jgi:hypothetical protein
MAPSQFSCDYSRLYGLSPLRDVENVREPVSGDVTRVVFLVAGSHAAFPDVK